MTSVALLSDLFIFDVLPPWLKCAFYVHQTFLLLVNDDTNHIKPNFNI